MGRADQLAKRIFTEETGAATGHRVVFEVPPEVPVGALQPDGLAHIAVASAEVCDLAVPWSRLRHEAVLDVKMPGDHIGRAALARCELRRWARWVGQLEQTTPDGAPPSLIYPAEVAAWVVTSHVPRWLREDAALGVITLEPVAKGVWRIGPRDHDTLWIAANELPLEPALLPFLVARSGRALLEFAAWAARVRGPNWIVNVLQQIPMGSEILDEIGHVNDDPAEQHRIHAELLRMCLRLAPEAANEAFAEARNEARNEGLEKGLEKGLGPVLRQFERKLNRLLTPSEHAELLRRLDTHGPERLGDAVLDLPPEALRAWLADPHAT